MAALDRFEEDAPLINLRALKDEHSHLILRAQSMLESSNAAGDLSSAATTSNTVSAGTAAAAAAATATTMSIPIASSSFTATAAAAAAAVTAPTTTPAATLLPSALMSGTSLDPYAVDGDLAGALERLDRCRAGPTSSLFSSKGVNLDRLRHRQQEFNYVSPSPPAPLGSPTVDPAQPELVLSVAIAHPRRENKMQEFLVLGSQPLLALRQIIHCTTEAHYGDPRTMDVSRSAYFYIEGAFFEDPHSNPDYVQNVREWMKKSRANSTAARAAGALGGGSGVSGWGRTAMVGSGAMMAGVDGAGGGAGGDGEEPPVYPMDHITFEMLTIRLFTPYLFCHIGDCEHLIYFTDVRFHTASDPPTIHSFPLPVFQGRIRKRRCMVCNIHQACKVVIEDDSVPEVPLFLCPQCHEHMYARRTAFHHLVIRDYTYEL